MAADAVATPMPTDINEFPSVAPHGPGNALGRPPATREAVSPLPPRAPGEDDTSSGERPSSASSDASGRGAGAAADASPATKRKDVGIRVVARFRPMNDMEIEKGSIDCVEVAHDRKSVTIETNKDRDAKMPGNSYEFGFSHVFDPFSSQTEVYEEAVAPIIHDIFNGINASVITYGQTGSGKTFTLLGPNADDPRVQLRELQDSQRGIIPRLLDDIFQRVTIAEADRFGFNITVSYIEVYMEKLRDLLDPRIQGDPWNKKNMMPNLDIHGVGQIVVQGVITAPVVSAWQALQLLQQGNLNRHTAKTKMNEESSRSHALFIITIRKGDRVAHVNTMAQLYLVDLAGSEKVAKTFAEGARLEEAKTINESLHNLGLVIDALSKRQGHVPYRNSKLTRLLTNAFGGDSKTTLIITCSPSSYNDQETLSTLRFGDRSASIKNKPTRNQFQTTEELKALLTVANARITLLEAELRDMKANQKAVIREALATAMSTRTTEPSSPAPAGAAAAPATPEPTRPQTAATPELVRVAANTAAAVASTAPTRKGKERLRETTEAEVEPVVQIPLVLMEQRRLDRERRNQEIFRMLCPISKVIMTDPVVAEDGISYERVAIEKWMKQNPRSPVTNTTFNSKVLFPNRNLLRIIRLRFAGMPVIEAAPDLISCLPIEVLDMIFSYFHFRDLGAAARVCPLFRDIIYNHLGWRHLLLRSRVMQPITITMFVPDKETKDESEKKKTLPALDETAVYQMTPRQVHTILRQRFEALRQAKVQQDITRPVSQLVLGRDR